MSVRKPRRISVYEYTGPRLQRTRLQRAPDYNEQIFFGIKIIDSNFEKFGYNEHSATTSRFFWHQNC